MESSRAVRLQRWEHRTAGALTVLAVLFIVVYAAPILRPGLPATWRLACEVVNLVIWALFGVDYLVRLGLSADRRGFVRDHVFDLVVLLLPMLLYPIGRLIGGRVPCGVLRVFLPPSLASCQPNCDAVAPVFFS